MVKSLFVFFALTTCCQAADYALLDFSATWCAPCRAMKPNFSHPEVVALLDRVDFYEIDIDRQSEYARSFKITSVPTVILIKTVGGKTEIVTRVVGYQSVSQLKKLLVVPPKE